MNPIEPRVGSQDVAPGIGIRDFMFIVPDLFGELGLIRAPVLIVLPIVVAVVFAVIARHLIHGVSP